MEAAFVRGHFVGSGSVGEAARRIAGFIGTPIGRAKACVCLARQGSAPADIEDVIEDAHAKLAEQAVRRAWNADNMWHTAPDGTECCCTAEDRRYGCGCS